MPIQNPAFLTRRRPVLLGIGATLAAAACRASLPPSAAPLSAGPARSAGGAGPVLGQGRHRYQVVPGWGVQDRNKIPVNDCNGIVCDSQNRILVLTNDVHNNVIIYDKAGKVLSTWGDKFPGAHGLSCVREGTEEFLFITDTNLHKIFKTTLDGRVLMAIGYPQEAGLYAKEDLYKPSATLHAPNGDFYVLDGYGIDYVMHYDHQGRLIRVFGGSLGEGDAQMAHWGPHGGGMDLRDPAHPMLLIAMSDQQTIKRYTLDGKYIDTLPTPGANPRQIVVRGSELFIPTLGDQWPKVQSSPGFISVLDGTNKMTANIGGTKPQYINGVLQKVAHEGNAFLHPHAIAYDDEGALYVAQWLSNQTYPIKLVPAA